MGVRYNFSGSTSSVVDGLYVFLLLWRKVLKARCDTRTKMKGHGVYRSSWIGIKKLKRLLVNGQQLRRIKRVLNVQNQALGGRAGDCS